MNFKLYLVYKTIFNDSFIFVYFSFLDFHKSNFFSFKHTTRNEINVLGN